MEVALFSESDPDAAGLPVLGDAVLGVALQPTPVPFRTRGWPVVADGNDSPLEPHASTNRNDANP